MKKRSIRLSKKLFVVRNVLANLNNNFEQDQQELIKGGETGISVCLSYCISCGTTCTTNNNTNLSVGYPCCKPLD